jgi:hypothetical protein
MRRNSLSAEEISELNRYSVWLARLSKSLNFMLGVVANLPANEKEAERFTVQERNKMLRLALEDLKVERENVSHALDGLQDEYQSVRDEFLASGV